MDHNDIRHMLSEYIDGAVLPGDRVAIEEHLKTCEKCNEALKELRQTVAHIKSVEEIDPPAWMTQKIMTKVHDEAETKTWFQRLFVPLYIKLPLEAIGVLFIAVTALFIYQNMQPSMKALRPQSAEQVPDQEVAPAVIAKNGEQRSAEPSPTAKKLPQSPGYKALDMKQEYERPAPPTPQSREVAPEPSFSKAAEQPAPPAHAEKKQSYTSDSENARALLSKEEASGRGMMQEGTAREAKAKLLVPAAPIAGAVSADKAAPAIILQVADVEAAAKGVEKAIAQVGGSILRRESPGPRIVFFVTIKAQRTAELKNKLKLLGEIKEQPVEWEAQKEQMDVRIEIIRRSAQP